MAWRGASASTWLRVGWFPSTLAWFEQSWASKPAAKACMAAWLSEAVHREMRAAARDVCKSGGACRAFAWASSLTPSAPRFNSEHHKSAATAPDEFRVGPFLPPPVNAQLHPKQRVAYHKPFASLPVSILHGAYTMK